MKRPFAIVLIFSLLSLSFSTGGNSNGMLNFLMEYLSIKYSDKEFDSFIYVAVKKQKLFLVENDEIVAEYKISTAKKGLGNKAGSFKTPQGLHQVVEKVGEEVEPFGIIKQKVPTGEKAEPMLQAESTNQDLITSRVMHLRGQEEGINRGGDVDSYNRGIFIHGTHEEGLIGKPASKGCIRMKNADIIDLFERIEVGTFVVILNN
jgi:lipoprotein-anchoring transpeptidase ErfK/SrfK